MKTRYVALAFIALSGVAAIVLADDAPPLTKDELQQMIPGSQVVSTGQRGFLRRWTNDPSGSFEASWETPAGVKRASGSAPGTWHISEDGKYCVHIEWPRLQSETWCAAVQKTADGKFSPVSDGKSYLPPQTAITK
ncbi:MAG TPA: hypothetical protein VG105_15395 [Paraburkholderia sp.]|jgi:hypothetical protein|nr:hypothetical protein [Paraburkholderia sp.]